jgi:ribosomal protein L37AE/L43A
MKIWITKHTKKPEDLILHVENMISLDAVKPYKMPEEEWEAILPYVNEIVSGAASGQKNIAYGNSRFDISRIENDSEAGILAESKRYYILRDYEEAELYRKPDSKYVASVGHFYGDPEDAYIDSEEKFCITIGCGIIKYNLCDPFEGYMYDRNTPQWVETGREGDIEWCDHIDEVTEDYIVVSLEGEEKRKHDINTLELIESTLTDASKENEKWHCGDTDWEKQVFQPFIEGKPEYPVKCPACNKASCHVYINRYEETSRGGVWVWCSNCHLFSHGSTVSVPDWWVNSSRVDEEKLCAADPEELVQYESELDDLVNRRMLNYGLITNACHYCLHKEYAELHISECPECGEKTLTSRLSGPCMIVSCSNCGYGVVGSGFYPPCHTDELTYTIVVRDVEKDKRIKIAKLFGLNVMNFVNRINEYGEVTQTAGLFDSEKLYLTLKELGVEVEIFPDFRRKFPDLIGCKLF